ncbi:MAG TPA: hypothetical protein DCX06_14085 [Opitutae bacterium]|nr:hypothetical protein [Opitutae bacterium]
MIVESDFIAQLSPHLFWDVDVTSIDIEKNAAFLIARIVERGTSKDVRGAWKFYGEKRMREVLTTAPSLSKKTIAFFAHQFRIPCSSFKAYQRGQNWAR